MKISMIGIGDTQDKYLKEGIAIFEKRIRHYVSFDMIYLEGPRNMKNQPEKIQKDMEGRLLIQALEKSDLPILLDVAGPQLTSEKFAAYIQKAMNKGVKNAAFIIGGAYGFSDEVYKAVSEKISLSEMTFSHQLIRLIFAEQLYRAFTILRGEPYHHA